MVDLNNLISNIWAIQGEFWEVLSHVGNFRGKLKTVIPISFLLRYYHENYAAKLG